MEAALRQRPLVGTGATVPAVARQLQRAHDGGGYLAAKRARGNPKLAGAVKGGGKSVRGLPGVSCDAGAGGIVHILKTKRRIKQGGNARALKLGARPVADQQSHGVDASLLAPGFPAALRCGFVGG